MLPKLLILFVAIFTIQAENLTSDQIYRIENREDTELFLTAIGAKKTDTSTPVIADRWRGAATQKWRLIVMDPERSLVELKPTSDESSKLSLDSYDPNLVSLDEYHWYNRIGINTSRHKWKVIKVDGGFSLLQNYKSEKCLQNMGNGKQIGVSLCANSHRQQWYLQRI